MNFYRNSELHGALLMGRLARTVAEADVIVPATRHCATEARHAAMLSEVIAALGGRIDPHVETVQQRYSTAGGIPTALVDVLVLSEVLERRVLVTYRDHVRGDDVHPAIARTLRAILEDMEEEDHGEGGSWIERALAARPPEVVAAAERRWRAVDEKVAAELKEMVAARFPAGRPA
ncbi:MAG TPA: ferritin-like domain-containing protein [Vicinamibacterales bacterium]|nr:ferritin-like domain-containing protein [Vicinamibacterales bacterium]